MKPKVYIATNPTLLRMNFHEFFQREWLKNTNIAYRTIFDNVTLHFDNLEFSEHPVQSGREFQLTEGWQVMPYFVDGGVSTRNWNPATRVQRRQVPITSQIHNAFMRAWESSARHQHGVEVMHSEQDIVVPGYDDYTHVVSPMYIRILHENWRSDPITQLKMEKSIDFIRAMALLYGSVIIPFGGECHVGMRPNIYLDDENRLHSEDGAAFHWDEDPTHINNGYLWHGIEVPPRAILDRSSITQQDIYQQPNSEVRRAFLYLYGLERFFKEVKPVHTDSYGKLYKLQFGGREVHTFVRVQNGTPDVSGYHREYLLPVPNNIQTAHAAVAWTYTRPVKDYAPVKRT